MTGNTSEDATTTSLSEAQDAKARQDGWVPEAEWDGALEDWVDAKQFNVRGELMGRITSQTSQLRNQSAQLDSQSKDIEKLKTALERMGEHNAKIMNAEYKEAVKSLQKERAQAQAAQDFDAVADIEGEIEDLKDAKAKVDDEPKSKDTPTDQGQRIPPAILNKWVEENGWYASDPAMQGAANNYAGKIFNEGSYEDWDDLLGQVTKQVKDRFPGDFKTTKSRAPAAVTTGDEPGGGKRAPGKRYTYRDLDDETLVVAKTFVEAGAFRTLQEYVDQFAATGGFTEGE